MLTRLLLTLLAVLAFATPAQATIHTADSCSQAHIQAKVAIAANGDTINVPAGTCSWTTLGGVAFGSKGIKLMGAGQGVTIILDDMAKSGGSNAQALTGAPAVGQILEITGFTFRGGSVGCSVSPCTAGFMLFSAPEGGLINIHHNDFGTAANPFVQVQIKLLGNCQYGAIHHNNFYQSFRTPIHVNHPGCDGGTNSDGQWAQAARWGSDKFIFIEDNYFQDVGSANPAPGIDSGGSGGGGRYVFRYNETQDIQPVCGGHGTDSGSRPRSTRAKECYGNVMRTVAPIPTGDRASHSRGGGILLWGNHITRFNSALKLLIHRSFDQNWPTWGPCGGTGSGGGSWDNYGGTAAASGTHAGANGATVLSASGSPGWTPNQYVGNGYSVCNLDKSAGRFPWCSNITANTANTITYSTGNCSGCTWDSANRFEVRQVAACMDMPGLGAGTLLSGNPPRPTGWTNQVVEPIYVWGNTHSSVTHNVLVRVSETGGRIIENTHYYQCLGAACNSAAWLTKGSLRGYSGTTVTRVLPGYTPYTYPHPLATCGAATCGAGTGGGVTIPGGVVGGTSCRPQPGKFCTASAGAYVTPFTVMDRP